jgi:hypothetical protein
MTRLNRLGRAKWRPHSFTPSVVAAALECKSRLVVAEARAYALLLFTRDSLILPIQQIEQTERLARHVPGLISNCSDDG